MNTKLIAVIGVNFGDEGKGQFVNNLIDPAYADNYLVVRYNGGAQAGHTVEYNGMRHVFSHFGSGTLKGARTYLTDAFICNPNVFFVERQELLLKQCYPKIYISGNSRVTTPFDVLWNRCLENIRGANQHGSVGLGINATIVRHKSIPFIVDSITNDYNEFVKTMEKIKKHYLNFSEKHPEETKLFLSCVNEYKDINELYRSFYEKCLYMKNCAIQTIDMYDFLRSERRETTVIFEGAQGLQLTEQYGVMPYCTPTSCSVSNIEKQFSVSSSFYDKKCNTMDVYYLTRPYITRHGAGPLPNEVSFEEISQFFNIVDTTNMPNDYQGSIRYAYMDPSKITSIVSNEASLLYTLIYGINSVRLNKKIVITCQDQLITTNVPIIGSVNSPNWSSRFDYDFSPREIINIDINALKSLLV